MTVVPDRFRTRRAASGTKAQHIWHDGFRNGSNGAIFRAAAGYLAHKHELICEPSAFALLANGILGLIGCGWKGWCGSVHLPGQTKGDRR
jgi:hypothetical protein